MRFLLPPVMRGTVCISALACAMASLSGCASLGAPTAGDDQVEFMVSADQVESWYDVTVTSQGQVVLHGNVTVAHGAVKVGALPPGQYDVAAASAGGLQASRAIEVTSRNVVYVTHREPSALRIIVETLGE